MRPPPCKYNCKKASIELVPAKDKAGNSKKQSAPGGLCSFITGILTNEIGKTKNKTKLGILKGGLKYANEICDAGGAPDLAKITKGLPEKDKIRIAQKTNAALFDGAADLPDKDFGINSSKTAPALTAGGQISDLKASEPDIRKAATVTDFSLSGTKLSGGTPDPATIKQFPILLAAASSAKTPADIAIASSSNTAASATAKAAVAVAAGIEPGFAGCFCKGTEYFIPASADVPNQAACPNVCCKTYGLLCPSGDCGPYDTKKFCCINGKVVEKLQTPKALLGYIKDCKNRVQVKSEKEVRPEKQGCSIAPRLGHLINIKERRFSRDGRLIALMLSWKIIKGIATKLFNLDSGRPPITDFNDPFTGLTPPFRDSCNEHDWRYGTCLKNAKDAADRRKCDDQLLKKLKNEVCKKAKYPLTKAECTELAEDMVWGLRHLPFGGSVAYAAAQIDHCKCDLCP